MECYYGQVGLNQAYLQSHISYLQSSHAKCISVRPEMYLDGSVLAFYRELFINFSTTSMFLVYPILPHFLGHNFLSLNPSISDKKNIQTLGGDSVVTPLCRAPGPVVPLSSPLLSFIFCLSIEISKSCFPLMLSSPIGSRMIYQQ